MAKGASIKFTSYEESVSKLLGILNLAPELKKYDKIVLKPHLSTTLENSTSKDFVESIIQFCLKHKNPVTEIFIAEGADGADTQELFQDLGYTQLAEKYGVSLIDLNTTETEEVLDEEFIRFDKIKYPSILKDSFVISLPKLQEDEETELITSTSNMLGAFPSSAYSGFFTKHKNKLRRWPIKYSIHDIVLAKMPNFAVVDASENGAIFAGLPLEIDKQSAKFLGKDWQRIPHIKLIHDTIPEDQQ